MTKRNIAIFAAVVVVVGLLWLSTAFSNYFESALFLLRDYSFKFPFLSVSVFVALAVVSTLIFTFSSVWLVPAAIGIWGKWETFLLLLSGWVIGNILSYLIGKYAGYPIVKRLVPERKMEEYKHLFLEGDRGWGIVFLSRFILPSEIPGYLLGIARYRFWPYFIATVLSEAPYALIAVYAIDAILRRDIGLFLVWGAIWAFCAIVLVRLIRRKLKQEPAEKH